MFPRFLRDPLLAALEDTPVVLIHGARQIGKTTLVRSVGTELGYTYLNFDDEANRQAATDDPSGFVRLLPERAILDEVQRVPELFATLKSAIDEDRRPARLIMTGSANVLLLPMISDSLAGRIEILRLHPLTQAEIENVRSQRLARLFDGDLPMRTIEQEGTGLLDRIVAGGYPEGVLRSNPQRRRIWYDNYLTTLIERDVRDLTKIRAVDDLEGLLRLIAGNTAGLRNITDLARPLSVSRPTVEEYVRLLRRLFLIDVVPAWHRNRTKRLVTTPKIYASDTGLACALLGVDAEGLVSDDDLPGRMVETFVLQELRRHASFSGDRHSFYHYRTRDGIEVDCVIERSDGAIIGVEVKSGATVSSRDFRGLRDLASAVGDRFVGGYLLYNGTTTLPFGDRMRAVPIAELWSHPG